MRIRLDNALIVDGSGAPAYPGCVLVEGERIAAVESGEPGLSGRSGEGLCAAEADRIIDLSGLALCPGFIDTHSHSDLAVLGQPSLPAKLRQGVTCEVLGQDGLGMAPLPPEHVADWRVVLAGLDGDSDAIAWDHRDTGGYLALLEGCRPAPNLCALVPHGNVRLEVMGMEGRPASVDECRRMAEVLDRELAAGGAGLSMGLIYPPCVYAETLELEVLCGVAAARNRPLVVHQRSEADDILASMEEVLGLGRRTGVHVHFSHFKICGKDNDGLLEPVLARLDRAAAKGQQVSFDQYPYTAGSTMLGVILPPWAHAGGSDKLLERLARREDRARMLRDIAQGLPGWDNFVRFAGVDGIFITSVVTPESRDAVGKSLAELGELRGKPPLEAALDLLLVERNGVGMVDFYGLERHVRVFMRRPEMNVCSDGLLGGTPHPRVYGAFPRVLGKYVREEGVLGLEEAVHKMTGRPAEVFHLSGRGLLAPGMFADLVAFDPATVRDRGTYTDPVRHPDGIEYVCVNGTFVVEQGRQTPARPGKVLRAAS